VPFNFHELFGDGGEAGAREKFERLIVLLAYRRHGAMGMLANPGDWGIDAFAGDLEGTIAVWQAKFFFDEVGDAQKQQIRDSFAAAFKAATEEGHTIDAWTLAIPIDFDAPATKWWQKWKRQEERENDVTIDLWSLTPLESILTAPDVSDIAHSYFPKSAPPASVVPAEVLDLPEDHEYDQALFIVQLEAAAIQENEAAKQQFFNYEALSRDVADKADPFERTTLQALEAEVHAIWEARFGAANPDADTGIDPALHLNVMDEIRASHNAAGATLPPLSVVHKLGSMHLIVDNGKAGWVKHFREIAQAYRA